MRQNNLQIRISTEVDAEIEALAPKSKSEFVRQAIEEKIQREKFQRLENQWIKALKKHPESTHDAKTWLDMEQWEKASRTQANLSK